MKRRLFLGSGLAMSFGATLVSAARRATVDDAVGVLEKSVIAGQIRAASIFVSRGSEVTARQFGAATSAESIFLLASISKPIVTTAVMALRDRNEFKLDDRVSKFLPKFTGDGREKMTMMHLLTHVSGLPDQLPQNAALRAAHAPLAEFTRGAMQTPLLFQPGARYSYSSMAILLATEVAQRITGMTIAELVEEKVYRPLKMSNSALGVGKFALASLMRCQVANAAPESGAGDPASKTWDWNSPYWRKLGVPWGGAHGSATDVATFLRAFLSPDGTVLKPATAKEMITNQNREGLRPRGLGFDVGRNIGPPASLTTFGHTGSTGTLCWADPPSDTICVILTTLPANALAPHPRDTASMRVIDASS
jgi:CubicO group peptidase (beta-lactamase class C family)